MQTKLADFIQGTTQGQEAEKILRSCVHCGFCNATCPTYQVLGDELDGPRGRIYLIKQVLEGNTPSRHTQLHLDRCLTCKSCETTCPSGVQYGRLLDIGRSIVERKLKRPMVSSWFRKLLRFLVPYPKRVQPFYSLALRIKPVLPAAVKRRIPGRVYCPPWPESRHRRKILILNGCVQAVLAPQIDSAAAHLLDRFGISVIRLSQGGCCGAVSFHLGQEIEAQKFARVNIDAWWPYIENGAESILVSASGCGVMVKDYGELLKHDPVYADKAAKISALVSDLSEIVADLDCTAVADSKKQRVAFHSPCTLQHGLQINGVVEKILVAAGYDLTSVPDSHLCCGSAGTYSILQPKMAKILLSNKLQALQSDSPDILATANIGCLMHLQSKTDLPVKHWVELL